LEAITYPDKWGAMGLPWGEKTSSAVLRSPEFSQNTKPNLSKFTNHINLSDQKLVLKHHLLNESKGSSVKHGT
jgi:hypothetical protein